MLKDTQIFSEKDRSLCDEQATDLDQLDRWTAHPEAVQRQILYFAQEECTVGVEKKKASLQLR